MTRRIDPIAALGTGGAMLFIFCLYASPSHLWPWTEVLRPAMLAATMMLAALVLRRVVRGEPVRFAGAMGASMVVLFALVALSALWALQPQRAVAFSLASSKLLLAFAGLATVLRTPKHVRLAMTLAALSLLVPAQGTLERWNDGIELVEGYRAAWIGLLANPNQLAMVMAVTVPWALVMWTHSKGLMRWVMLASFGLACATVVVTHSRGGALGLAVAVVTWVVLARQRLRAITLAVIATLAVVVFAPTSFWNRTETISDYEHDASAQGRLHAWEAGRRALSDNPLLGIGADNYLAAWDRYMPRNVREHAYTAHNTWMQVLVELGVLGLAVFAVMIVATARGLWKARDGILGDEARAMLASLAALVACGATGGYAFNWFFYMVLGVAGAVLAQDRLARARERSRARLALA